MDKKYQVTSSQVAAAAKVQSSIYFGREDKITEEDLILAQEFWDACGGRKTDVEVE